MPSRARSTAVGLAAAAVIAAGSATALADGVEPDGVHLRADFVGGGDAQLELEDRGPAPAVCFIWDHPAPHDGDSIASRVLDRAGRVVVDLGTADQWVDGAGKGCELPEDDRYREVFADPERYVVEFRVVEEQGTPPTSPVRSGPLSHASD